MPLLYEPFGRTATGRLQHGLKRFPIVSSCGRVCTGQPPHFGACHASSTRIPPSVEASGSQDLASNVVASSAIGTQFTDESVSMVESSSADEVAVHSLSTGNAASSSTSSGNNGIRPASDFKGAIRVQPSDFEEVCVFEESPDGSVTINCMPLTDAVAGASVGSQGTVGDILNKTHTPDVKAGASISSSMEHAPGSIVTAALLHQQREQAAARQGFPAGPAADVSPAAVDMTSTFDEAADFRRGGVGTGSIDRDDTPEGLADVEATSVAPIADWFKNKVSTAALPGMYAPCEPDPKGLAWPCTVRGIFARGKSHGMAWVSGSASFASTDVHAFCSDAYTHIPISAATCNVRHIACASPLTPQHCVHAVCRMT